MTRCAMPPLESSPHTRGARDPTRLQARRRGIIPAYAGSILHDLQPRERLQDHPRIPGEHPSDAVTSWMAPGSSPHTRGALKVLGRPRKVDGIIPAYAGSTYEGAMLAAA